MTKLLCPHCQGRAVQIHRREYVHVVGARRPRRSYVPIEGVALCESSNALVDLATGAILVRLKRR